MTKQQLKDYEKIQSLEILKMWTEWTPEYKGLQIEELPIECAISDIDTLLDNALVELRCTWEDDERYKELQTIVKKSRTFLKKYK